MHIRTRSAAVAEKADWTAYDIQYSSAAYWCLD